jgi:CubicO group peptidase (beta-lactamase class C family)
MDSGKLIEMMEKVRDENYAIDSITIIRNGYLVTDAYIYPFRKNTKHVIHSVTKSFTSVLVGIALDKGYIKSVKQPLLEFFPEKTIANLDEQKKAITLEHLLIMSSGLDTKDSWLYQWVGLAKMRASDDWAQYVLDRPMAQIPGGHFDYSNGGFFSPFRDTSKIHKGASIGVCQKTLIWSSWYHQCDMADQSSGDKYGV